MTRDLAIHLLDVGSTRYSDAILLELGGRRILIDGAHSGDLKSIGAQIRDLLDEERPRIDLLIVSHTHDDHIGCLPDLVADLEVHWALLADRDYGWGRTELTDGATLVSGPWDEAIAGLREEPVPEDIPAAELRSFLRDAADSEPRYAALIESLRSAGTKVFSYGRDDTHPLEAEFAKIEFQIVGPTVDQLTACAEGIQKHLAATRAAVDALATVGARMAEDLGLENGIAGIDAAEAYRLLVGDTTSERLLSDGVPAPPGRDGDLVNLQSLVVTFRHRDKGALFTGDMELANRGGRDRRLREGLLSIGRGIESRRPFAFVKVPHHGSANGLSRNTLTDVGTDVRYFGVVTGIKSDGHPVLSVLRDIRTAHPESEWARTDRNGRTTFEFTEAGWRAAPDRGQLNDETPPL